MVWSGELDTFGKLRTHIGEQGSCPFRYQGQYEDVETGLYYNRFRYFDPEEGRYVSKDPIGLFSGEFGFYNYVGNANGWVDLLGLEMVTVYHYTNKEGYNAINRNGVIKASDPSKRGKGGYNNPKGVYVSKLSPEQMAKQDLGKIGMINSKTEFVASFQIDSSKLKDASKNGSKLYIEEDINLRKIGGKIEKNTYSKK